MAFTGCDTPTRYNHKNFALQQQQNYFLQRMIVLQIFHLYNRISKKVVPFKFKIHCSYSSSPSKKIATITYLYRHHSFTLFHRGLESQSKKQKTKDQL